ncbi:MAG: hypothetical protein CMP22_02275 [Rickettsiales bacterium]|nr:hypothetical protein [Rickettsiales bacterium]
MARLESLIRYHKHDLDEKRKHLGNLNSQATELENQLDTLEKQKDKEAELAKTEPLLGQAYSNYLVGYKKMKATLLNQRAELEKEIEAALFEIQEKFTELKKYEVLHEKRLKEKRIQEQKEEDKAFDEMALEIYERKKKEKTEQ